MTEFVNLTPHTVNLSSGQTFAPSGQVARVASTETKVAEVEGVSLLTASFGEVTDLPEPREGTFFVVSGMVRAACPDRKDLASPGRPVRNEAGQVVGCEAFLVNG